MPAGHSRETPSTGGYGCCAGGPPPQDVDRRFIRREKTEGGLASRTKHNWVNIGNIIIII